MKRVVETMSSSASLLLLSFVENSVKCEKDIFVYRTKAKQKNTRTDMQPKSRSDTPPHMASRVVHLQNLSLSSCKLITDAGLAHLKGLVQLQTLDLWSCRLITDGGLAHLEGLVNLRLCR